jgi:Ca-activated chloride channel homolog
MDLLWPGFLPLLGLLPLIVGAYIWMLRRRRPFTVRYSSLSLVRDALPRHSRLRRHLPFTLFLLALASLMLALMRPLVIVSMPTNQTVIIVAMDVSRSMRQTDIPPSRLDAAQAAALDFIQNQKSGMRIGIVAFAGFAQMIQPPTTDQEALQAAVERLTTGRGGTAIGSGILESIDVIAEINKNVAPSQKESSREAAPRRVLRGTYVPDMIVVLTDGVSTTGPLPLDAAQRAVDRGIRVYTIGFGTANGSLPPDGSQLSNPDPQYGGGFLRGIDEETLKRIAQMTGGAYYAAESASELQDVFQNLSTYSITRHETMEVSVAFTAVGALLVVIAVALSLIWNPLL